MPLLGAMLLVSSQIAFGDVNVTQYHNNATRDGLYIDPAFTTNAAANLKRDTNFNGAIGGNVYAQPLYIEGGPGGRAMVIAVTESNNVYALDAATGSVIWQRNVGVPVRLSTLPCGNIDPLGITGTPVVDLATRTLFFDAMTGPVTGTTNRHLICALNVDTGTTNSGWPVDVSATAKFGTNSFNSLPQNQRSALGLFDGHVYVSYGGHSGDCSVYYGWIVGVQESDPTSVLAWSTAVRGGGSWSVGGISTDGTNPFIATGNTFGATSWSGGEAVVRFQPGPVFSGLTNDYWAPTNWALLDTDDLDLGGCGPLIVDVPGATPSQLVVALGKDTNVYVLNRTNLGGVSTPLAQAHLGNSELRGAAVTYQTALGTYVAFGTDAGQRIVAFRITPTSPPKIVGVWTNSYSGRGSPFVTSTDGTNNVVVWVVGEEGDQRLHGFNADTGAVVYSGGGANEVMSGTHHFSTAIAARGRIYVGNDNRVFAFTVPVLPIVLTDPVVLPDGTFQFGFTNIPGLSFTVYGTTNLALPHTNWTDLGSATEVSPGQFQFTDSSVGLLQQFYRVTTP